MKGLWVAAVVGLGTLASGVAPAQDATPKAASGTDTTPAQATPPATTVVVQGKRNEVTDRIDRRTYDIKNDPDSQSGNAGDVLSKIPSVTVNPAGRVALRGDTSVTVLIDGKYPVNGNNFTQTLAASDIDRIEVMTNPSAQYAADGTGGIINIITKKRHPFGLSGTVGARWSTLDQGNLNGSLSITKGQWSLTGRVNGCRYPGRYGSSSVEAYPDAVVSGTSGRYDSECGGGALEASRKIGDHQTLTLNGTLNNSWSQSRDTSYFQSAGRAFTSASAGHSRNNYNRTEFIFDDNNDTTGRHFTLDASVGVFGGFNNSLETDSYTVPAVGQAIYGGYNHWSGPDDDIKADYEMRPKSGNILTAGMEWTRNGSDEIDTYVSRGTIAGPHADGSTRAFYGTRNLTAAYITYQRPLFAGWTMLPGLRAEYEALDIRSQGLRVTPDALRLYPTLHLSHDLGKGKVTLSYSRRVDRPNLTQYDPARTYQNLVYASQGNPDLKPPETDSYEAGYAYSQGKVSYDATLYYRALTNAVSDLYQDLGTGVTLDRQVNSGHSRSAGSEFTAKTPISKHWKVSVNLNVFYNEVPLLSGATQQSRGNVTYSSNSTLEYDADKGDQLQMAFAVTGRQLTAQGYNSQTSHLDLTWRHNLTKKLALVVNAQDVLLGNKQTIVYQTSDLRTRSFQPAFDRLIRVGLTRTFGGPAGK